MLGKDVLSKLILDYDFDTVLDIGSGNGQQSKAFVDAGKTVTSVDIRSQRYGDCCDYMIAEFESKFDCAWCCHVLEHQPNVNLFLKKISNDVVDNGLIVITVPPMKNEIVNGHISVWNAGLLIYNLVMAGINCRDIQVRTYGYNVSVIVRNKKFELPNNLFSDIGELTVLDDYLPECITHNMTGQIASYNWDKVI